MATQTYSLEFHGYRIEVNKSSLPAESGIYCVYRCTYDREKGTVSLKKLIYIGESQNIKERVDGHEKLEDWQSYLESGEILCYSYTLADETTRKRCEAAMIIKHNPPVNTEYVNSFPFDKTTVILTDKIALLTTPFTVTRT